MVTEISRREWKVVLGVLPNNGMVQCDN
jgi:hypothetical protein